jgi:hypothetical protein
MKVEAGTGIEPVYKDLQSSTSPLCHPATAESLPVFQGLYKVVVEKMLENQGEVRSKG